MRETHSSLGIPSLLLPRMAEFRFERSLRDSDDRPWSSPCAKVARNVLLDFATFATVTYDCGDATWMLKTCAAGHLMGLFHGRIVLVIWCLFLLWLGLKQTAPPEGCPQPLRALLGPAPRRKSARTTHIGPPFASQDRRARSTWLTKTFYVSCRFAVR